MVLPAPILHIFTSPPSPPACHQHMCRARSSTAPCPHRASLSSGHLSLHEGAPVDLDHLPRYVCGPGRHQSHDGTCSYHETCRLLFERFLSTQRESPTLTPPAASSTVPILRSGMAALTPSQSCPLVPLDGMPRGTRLQGKRGGEEGLMGDWFVAVGPGGRGGSGLRQRLSEDFEHW